MIARTVRKCALMCTAVLLLAGPPARACNIPVFRYALERWAGDSYEVVVFHRGALSPEVQAALDALEERTEDIDSFVNLTVRRVDLNGPVDEQMQQLWKAQKQPKLPWMAVRDPKDNAIWSGDFTGVDVKRLVNSPGRQQTARRLLKGDAAVWVLLESGSREKDEAVAKLLAKELKRLESELEIPGADGPAGSGTEAAAAPAVDAPELRVAFSMLRISRTDDKELLFVRMLMNVEPDLEKFSAEPMVFPIFGRGRALPPMMGKGITADNIEEAGAFLVGPCSCQVKDLNPGTDLLMTVDWEGLISGRLAVDQVLPPLTTLTVPVPPEKETEAPEATPSTLAASDPGSASPSEAAPIEAAPSEAAPSEASGGGALGRNLLVLVVLSFCLLLAATLVLRRKAA